MQVTIDPASGFCFGVKSAVKVAETELLKADSCFILGDIVHNEAEMNRLGRQGLKVIDHAEFNRLKNARVMIRAHGEPPSTFETARRNSTELIDATCPVVLKLQRDVANAWKELQPINGQLVIYGKAGHPEVKGLVGQASGEAIIVTGPSDLKKIDFNRPVALFSQTTMSLDGFRALAAEIRSAIMRATGSAEGFRFHDSVCRQVANRAISIRQFAASHDVIIFVAGSNSSNGIALYASCREANKTSYMVGGPSQLEMEWFKGAGSVGVCGATSTPLWLMEEVADAIRKKC